MACCTTHIFGGWKANVYPPNERFAYTRTEIQYDVDERGFVTFEEALDELNKSGHVTRLECVRLQHFPVFDPVFQEEVLTALKKTAPRELAEAERSAGNMHNPSVLALRKPFVDAVLTTPTVRRINTALAPFGRCVTNVNIGEKFHIVRNQGRSHFRSFLTLTIAAAPPSIVAAARSQVGKTLMYDSDYVRLAYPMGDVPIEKGVCTDVVIRAFRDALKVDLQQLVHEDMTAAFAEYPKNWGLAKPDRNIDHRRVPNLKKYFERKGFSVAVSKKPEDYLPGDLVTCTVNGRLPHIMIVSDRKTAAGVPLVIHNIGRGAQEEDRLFDFPVTGHYRVK